MNKTWENGWKPRFGLDFGPFWIKFGPPNFFFVGFTSTRCYVLLQAIIVSNFKENQCTKLEKIAKNLVSGLILAPLTQIWVPKVFSVDLSNLY